jgi:hypothetical protein
METKKTYTNEIYTRTVEIIKPTKGCIELGWQNCVKVTTISIDPRNPELGKIMKNEKRYYTSNEWLDYDSGHCYYYKSK